MSDGNEYANEKAYEKLELFMHAVLADRSEQSSFKIAIVRAVRSDGSDGETNIVMVLHESGLAMPLMEIPDTDLGETWNPHPAIGNMILSVDENDEKFLNALQRLRESFLETEETSKVTDEILKKIHNAEMN